MLLSEEQKNQTQNPPKIMMPVDASSPQCRIFLTFAFGDGVH